MVGGARGGSGQYAYSLGRRGFYLHFDGDFKPARVVNYHTLAIADAYVALRRLELAGGVGVAGLSAEPDCWMTIGRVELRPDLYLDLLQDGRRFQRFCEVDMGSESQRQLRGKLDEYRRAWIASGEAGWAEFPGVWWIAIDEERGKELRWLISQLPADEQVLHSVCTLTAFPQAVL